MASIINFNELDPQQKCEIFQYLPGKERQEIRLVCRNWRNIVNKDFGLKIRVQNDTSDLVSTCKHALEVELCSMTIPFPSGCISFSKRLQSLKFSNITVKYNIIRFLRDCNRINSLSFSKVTIDIPMDGPWSSPEEKEVLVLGKLERLNIVIDTFTPSVVELLHFLKDRVEYGSLKEIVIKTITPQAMPLYVLISDWSQEHDHHIILKLVSKNWKTIRKFVFGRMSIMNTLQFHPFGIYENDIPVQLSHLTVDSYFYRPEDWAAFFANQRHIELIDLGNIGVFAWNEICQGIAQNSSTLRNIRLYLSNSLIEQNWDCSVFQDCTSLQSLTLEINVGQKVNLRKLPLQLQQLSIWGPIVLSELISILNLVNLKALKISSLDMIGVNEKVTVGTFKAFIHLPLLTDLSFVSCSHSSLDWSNIHIWCDDNDKGLSYEKHCSFIRINGKRVQNGITVTLSPQFEKILPKEEKPENVGTWILNFIFADI